MKSLGLPPPAFAFEEDKGTDLGVDAAKSWSRNRYSAARITPRVRTRTSDDEAMVGRQGGCRRQGEEKRRGREGRDGEKVGAVEAKDELQTARRLYRPPDDPKFGRSCDGSDYSGLCHPTSTSRLPASLDCPPSPSPRPPLPRLSFMISSEPIYKLSIALRSLCRLTQWNCTLKPPERLSDDLSHVIRLFSAGRRTNASKRE